MSQLTETSWGDPVVQTDPTDPTSSLRLGLERSPKMESVNETSDPPARPRNQGPHDSPHRGWGLTVERRRASSSQTERLGPVETAELDEKLSDEIEGLMGQTNLLSLPEGMGSPATGDVYEYRLTVEERIRPLPNVRMIPIENSVFLGSRETTTAPPDVFALINLLERRAGLTYVPVPAETNH
jgi:hypothetical protein